MDKVLVSSKSDEWYTPHDFFEKCSQEVGGFDLDPCSTIENHKAPHFFTIEDDGLSKEWFGKVFVNPPYSKLKAWAEKCSRERERERVSVIYLLIPARTDTIAFHDYMYEKEGVEIRFLKGRLKFGGSKDPAPFPSMLVIFHGKGKENEIDIL